MRLSRILMSWCGQEVIQVSQGAALSSSWDDVFGVPPRERAISSSRLTRLEIGSRQKILDT